MTKIIIDSTADLPDEIIEKYDIDMLSLRVSINSEEYLDRKAISTEEVYDQMRKDIYPTTSLPNPLDIYKLFEGHASRGRDFIFYCFTSELSSTYQTSFLIIEELKEKYPDVKMKILDTRAGCVGSALIAHQAAKLSQEGYSFEDIVKISKQNIDNVEHVFTLNNLDWISKGGRLSKGGAIIGTALKINPILTMEDGEIGVIQNVRGRNKAIKTILSIVEERINSFTDQVIGIAHSDSYDMALKIRDMIVERFGTKNIIITKIGSVLATHLGIGGIGVMFFNQEPDIYINEI